MKPNNIDARGEQMLELLAQGASARVVARKLGYSEGTTRVYLHNLYKAIGVRNKTEAVIWHLGRTRTPDTRAAVAPAASPVLTREFFGEMALAEDLYTALGAMSAFIGPYGHVWEAGMRVKGTPIDDATLVRRGQSRLLWRALLRGDFAYGKALYDEGFADRLLLESPSDGVLLATLLLIGGYTAAAAKVVSQLERKRKARPAITARESTLLRSLRDAMHADDGAALANLYGVAADAGGNAVLRQVAMAALFHVYRAMREAQHARNTASAIWVEAENARQQLEVMGVRPLPREAAVPRPGKAASIRETAPAREKELVLR